MLCRDTKTLVLTCVSERCRGPANDMNDVSGIIVV